MNKEFVKLIINDDDDVFFMDIKDIETDEKDIIIIVKILNKNC